MAAAAQALAQAIVADTVPRSEWKAASSHTWQEVHRPDESGQYQYHYSLTQRVFIVFQRATRPLDRRDVMDALNIGAEGLDHAVRRLASLDAIRIVPGVYGFYELVPGATMPEDTRGRNPKSHGNRGKRGADNAEVPSEAA